MSETTVINPDPTPKQKFLAHTKHVRDHNAMVESELFDLAIDIALLEYQRMMVATIPQDNMSQCACGHVKITGAMEFIKVLKRLGLETQAPPTTKPVGNLQHS